MKKIYHLYRKLLPVVAAMALCCITFQGMAQEIPINICVGDTVTIHAKVQGNSEIPLYLWKVKGKTVTDNTYPIFKYTPDVGDTIQCFITPQEACKEPDTLTYVIKSDCSDDNFIDYFVCSDAPITLVADVVNGGDNPDFQWIKNRVAVLSGVNDSTYTFTPHHNDTVYCVIIPDLLCGEPVTIPKYVIKFQNFPTLSLATSDTILCDTLPVIISGNTFGGTASKIEKITITNGGGAVAWSAPGSPFSITYTPVGSDTGKIILLTITTDSIAPCPPAVRTILLRINAKSVINLSPTVSNVCSEETLNFSVSHANITGWTRAAVDGISNPAGSGSGNSVSETLINTKNTPILVEYIFTINTSGCIVIGKVGITVKPKVPLNAKIKIK